MLSYRHAFHAGNYADVIKHVVLVEILRHLCKKDAPFEYIDTHSGAGLYNLAAPDAQKLQEFAGGIGKLSVEAFPELAAYLDVVASFNSNPARHLYPGSPAIAKTFLRRQDRGWLFELHPKDAALLSQNMAGQKNIRVQHKDGFAGLKALVPPTARRGLVLIDPSYEIKSDYPLVVEQVIQAHRKFSNGIYAIWYPVVDRHTIVKMTQDLANSGIRNIQRYELGIAEDSAQHGMTSSGMIVINPPWTLFDTMAALLPKLSTALSGHNTPIYQCDVLVDE